METHFAPAERVSDSEINRQLLLMSQNPVVDGLLSAANGLLAVLNEQRQILAVNDILLKTAGMDDLNAIRGLRPGEAISCIHAHEHSGGCGTSQFCSSCGAAIAIVSCLGMDRPVERTCAITTQRGEQTLDLYFRVRSCPIRLNGQRLLLLFMQDISIQHQWMLLQKAFFHDLNNLLVALVGSCSLTLPTRDPETLEIFHDITKISSRLNREVQIQRALIQSDLNGYQTAFEPIILGELLDDLRLHFSNSPAADGKELEMRDLPEPEAVVTDGMLLTRVLVNMLVNAFEASSPGDVVKLWIEKRSGGIRFCVWNRQFIPDKIARRIFQRYFSTKPGVERGIGTFSMRLLTEHYLRGTIDFTTTEADGTVFSLMIPETGVASENPTES